MENKLTSVFFHQRKENFKIRMQSFVFLCALLVFGLLPNTVLAQNAKIKIDQDKIVTVDEVFNLIMSQTNYTFIYQVKIFNNYPKVKIEKGTIEVDDLLKKALSQGEFNFSISNNTISINEIPKFKEKKEIIISGKVIDKAGMGVPGATVYVTNTHYTKSQKSKDFQINGTTTDFDGSFSLKGQEGFYLNAEGMGFEPFSELITGDKNKFTIIVKERVSELEQVLVVGYGTTKKKDLTGAMGSIKAEEIVQVKGQTLDQSLGGRISGVNVTAVSGKPGAGATVNIRGLSSLRGDNQPLYVIDGVPLNINPAFQTDGLGETASTENPLMAINPNDIERIDILKDASSAAIYGSRAANGVIIVTTKRGKRNQKPQFNFSVNSTFQNPTATLHYLNAEQYKAFSAKQAQIRIDEGMDYPFDPAMVDGSYFGNANTDWQDKIINKNALMNEYRFNVSGGSENVNYLVAGTVTDQEGIMIGSKFKRYNFASNLDATVTEHIKIGTSINYNYSINNTSNVSSLNQANFRPDLGVFDQNGEYTTTASFFGPNLDLRNPVGGEGLAKYSTISQNIVGSIYGEVKLLEGLSFKSLLSVSTNTNKVNNYNPSFSENAVSNPIDGSPQGLLTLQNSNGYSTSFSNTLNYKEKFQSGHAIDAVAGISWDQSQIDLQEQNYAGFPDDFILTNAGSANRTTTWRSEKLENGLNSIFGRVNYIYKDRYLATFTARRDGSTKFGPANKFGFFPSGALAWNIHNEKFFTSRTIDQLKLRASMGKTGSDNLTSFSYLSYLTSLANGGSVYADINGIVINSLPNDNIKWEETTQLDFGLEFGMFNNRLTGEVAYFKKKTNGIILYTPLPAETGTISYNSNVADVSNKGWEITIGGDVIRTKNFKWNSSFNISFVKNNVDALNGGTIFPQSNSTAIKEGEPIGIILGYDVVGIAQNQAQIDALDAGSPTGVYYGALYQPGDYIYRDVNGDGRITSADRTKLGDINPDYFGGWNNNLTYKDFSLSFNFQYSQGNDKQLQMASYYNVRTPENNSTTLVYDTWSPENPNATYQRIGGNVDNTPISKDVSDASYIRLRSASFGYNFPKQWLEKTEIASMRLSLSGNNLFTITDYVGLDPESVNIARGGRTIDLTRDTSGNYPIARTFTIGLNVGF